MIGSIQHLWDALTKVVDCMAPTVQESKNKIKDLEVEINTLKGNMES